MRTEQIQYFLETVKMGSVTKAANTLHISQPSLREAIINLEKELGEALFIRSKKGMILTDYGEYCVPYFRNMLDSYEKMKSKTFHKVDGNKFKIDLHKCYNHYLSEIYRLMQIDSETQYQLNTIENEDRFITRLLNGFSDVAFIAIFDAESPKNLFRESIKKHSIESQVIKKSSIYAMMRRDHPLAHKPILNLTDLEGQLLVYSQTIFNVNDTLKDKINLNKCEILVAPNMKLVEQYCMQYDGITFLPNGCLDDSSFVLKALKNGFSIEYQMLYRKGEYNKEMTRCMNIIKSILKDF